MVLVAGRFRPASVTEHCLATVRVRETRLVMPASGLRAYQVRVQVSSPPRPAWPQSSAAYTMPRSSYFWPVVWVRQVLEPVR